MSKSLFKTKLQASVRLAQNIGLLKQANFLTEIQKKIRANHKIVNKYSATVAK